MPRHLPLDERLETAAQLVLRSRSFYDIWLYLKDKGNDTPPAIIDAMQRFSHFFRYDIEAHFVAFVVQIGALFDKDKKTINFPRLAKELKVANLISAKDAAEVDALLSQAEQLASKVTMLRSNLFAHRSVKLSYTDAFKKAAVTPNQLRDLTKISLKIANRLLLARGLKDRVFNPLPQIHAEEMLKALVQKYPNTNHGA